MEGRSRGEGQSIDPAGARALGVQTGVLLPSDTHEQPRMGFAFVQRRPSLPVLEWPTRIGTSNFRQAAGDLLLDSNHLPLPRQPSLPWPAIAASMPSTYLLKCSGLAAVLCHRIGIADSWSVADCHLVVATPRAILSSAALSHARTHACVHGRTRIRMHARTHAGTVNLYCFASKHTACPILPG